ncbi:MAG: bifunctional diguanylate cyclase/phosphodiesterase [Steroidobacteraceae bacterium]
MAAHGRERVTCVIREAAAPRAEGGREGVRSGAVERREFFDRLRNAIADASLRERRLALCMVHVGGLDDIGGIIDHAVSQEIVSALLLRVAAPRETGGGAGWQCARVGDGALAAIVRDFDDRNELRDIAEDLQRRLREPVAVGDAQFAVRPCIGVAVLGDDGRDTAALLDHAQTAMLEARRDETGGLHFYSDSLKLRSLARLDFQRELREAIAADHFALRYAARCELADGRLAAANAYLRWPGELRRDVKPAEFLPVAETTGLALELSRWALRRLRRDAPALRALGGEGFRMSFGALRQHFASDALLEDVTEWLRSGEIEAQELELRLSERVLAGLASPGRLLRPLHELGVRLVVDEFGRGVSSLPRLARMPLWGLQIDRALATTARQDPVAARTAQAALSLAGSLALVPIVSGIDDADDLARWRGLGCAQDSAIASACCCRALLRRANGASPPPGLHRGAPSADPSPRRFDTAIMCRGSQRRRHSVNRVTRPRCSSFGSNVRIEGRVARGARCRQQQGRRTCSASEWPAGCRSVSPRARWRCSRSRAAAPPGSPRADVPRRSLRRCCEATSFRRRAVRPQRPRCARSAGRSAPTWT